MSPEFSYPIPKKAIHNLVLWPVREHARNSLSHHSVDHDTVRTRCISYITYVLVLLARQTPEPCLGTSRGFSDNRCKIRADTPARPRKTRSSTEETAGRPGELCRNRNGTGSNLHEIVRFRRNARTKPQLTRAHARAFHATVSVSLLVD